MQNIAELEIIRHKANSKTESEIKGYESKIDFLTGKLDQEEILISITNNGTDSS